MMNIWIDLTVLTGLDHHLKVWHRAANARRGAFLGGRVLFIRVVLLLPPSYPRSSGSPLPFGPPPSSSCAVCMSAEASHRPGCHGYTLRLQIPPRRRPFAAALRTRSSGSHRLPALLLPFHRCPMLGHIARAAREPPASLGAPKSRRAAALLPPPLAPAPPAPRRPPALLLPNRIDAPRPGISYVPPMSLCALNPALPPAVCRRSARRPSGSPSAPRPPPAPFLRRPTLMHITRAARVALRPEIAPRHRPFAATPRASSSGSPPPSCPPPFPTHLTPHTRASLTCPPCHSAPSNPAPPLAVCRRSARPLLRLPVGSPPLLLLHFFDAPRRGISYVPPRRSAPSNPAAPPRIRRRSARLPSAVLAQR
ncbi:hypothetical protein B0H10DRAFT_2221283 [Mycena sp. CBHHK59/15]|nr:hypothetical protein B0H10DRAFT_2221283 [Mycena sp. CBHHK59/15]